MSKIEKAATSAANTDDGASAKRLTKEHPYFIRGKGEMQDEVSY